ncbi:High mobility group nucleosome-binding domain-containing protein 3 [Camelus dromedarius]|uniref:High mobility group nucleosome-binding domain-containing protein 3 n=1 Tax=Camelus dromedarius TaxID=9838 RepID=A0A5N4DVL0_CAMDR|nr:High mobility group nucleosome-binding domain-containing protein 3 [Camelus dromedarius]
MKADGTFQESEHIRCITRTTDSHQTVCQVVSGVMSDSRSSGNELPTVSVYALDGKAQREPGTKINKGAKGKKEEKPEAGKEGTAPSENGETKAEEIHISRSTVNVSASRGTPPSTLSVKGQIETVRVKGTEN